MKDFFKSVPQYFWVVITIFAFSWLILSAVEIGLKISQYKARKEEIVTLKETAKIQNETAKIINKQD